MNTTHDRIRETSIEVTVGFFMFMIVLALGIFTIVLSRQSFLSQSFEYEVSFSEVQGIREGESVSLRGVDVGKIRDVRIENKEVVLTLLLNEKLDLREDYRFEIITASMLGGKYLHIFEGTPDKPELPEHTKLVGVRPVDLVEEATRTVESIRKALVEDGILDNLKSGVEKLNTIVSRVERGEGTVGKLLKEEQVYNDLAAIAEDLKTISDKISRGEGTLGKFMMDDGEIYDRADSVLANLDAATQNIARYEGTLGKLLSDDDTVYEDLKATAESLRTIAADLERGEGTLGKLLEDEGLYTEFRLLINEARATLDDFRETAPISSFVSIFMGFF
ncbi:MAG: MCE family protein [Kiritimatiellae bacterium]|nr:MCE family protein [Kiritimatiellia bacterium]